MWVCLGCRNVFHCYSFRFSEIKNEYKWSALQLINLVKTKRHLLYIRIQSVPRCKHFPPRL